MRKKVSVIGAGNVGATTALLIAQAGLSDITLYDVLEGIPQGKALDILEACPLWGSDVSIKGTNDYEDTKGSDIVVITAGQPRKPGMSRDDLLFANAGIVKESALRVSELSPSAIIIVVTNPMDVMAYLTWKTSGFEPKRVIGMGGVLDSSRLRTFVSQLLNVTPADVEVMVLGGHGDEMVPLPRITLVKGVPITGLLSKAEIDGLTERTRHGGAEIVSFLKTGSAYYAPAASVFEMVKSIILNEQKTLPCSAYLNGEYGVKGVYAGVPVILGSKGIEKIIELRLNKAEKKAFEQSINSVRALIKKLNI